MSLAQKLNKELQQKLILRMFPTSKHFSEGSYMFAGTFYFQKERKLKTNIFSIS